jgi:hypothetical protein
MVLLDPFPRRSKGGGLLESVAQVCNTGLGEAVMSAWPWDAEALRTPPMFRGNSLLAVRDERRPLDEASDWPAVCVVTRGGPRINHLNPLTGGLCACVH